MKHNKAMCALEHYGTHSSGAIFAMLISLLPGPAIAEEVTAYRLTDTEGSIDLRYRNDSEQTQLSSGPVSENIRISTEEELRVMTHGYIYHPNFLKIDLGGGVLFDQEDLETAGDEVSDGETLYSLSTRLMFLDKKPYPLTLYYEQSHPSVALNLTEVFSQEDEKYGLNFSLREPVSPVRLNFEAYRNSNEGESFRQVINNQITHQSVSAQSSFTDGGFMKLSHSNNRQESLSGTKGQLILPFSVTTKTTDLSTRMHLDKQKKADFNMNAAYITHEQDRDLTELRFSPNLGWDHSDNLSSSYRYNLLRRKQGVIENNSQSAAFGVRYEISSTTNSNAGLRFQEDQSTGLEQNSVGGQASISYKNKFDFGELQLSAGMNYDEYDRTAPTAVQVVEAEYTLVGITKVTLAHEYIDTATIVVRRKDTNEVLIEDVHYIVTTVGNQTLIEKKSGSGLPDPLDVFVSYEYNPGGSAKYDSFAYNLNANVTLYKYFTVFMRYRDMEQTLESGLPTLPLDTSDTTIYGVKADYTLPTDVAFTVGGELTDEKHNENISSFKKNNYDIYMQVDLPFSSNLNISMRRLQVDNLFSVEDVDLTRYSARLRASPAHRLNMSLQLSDEKDVGGSLLRRSQHMNLTAQWRFRKLLIELAARKRFDRQGITKEDQAIFTINAKREF